MARLFYIKILNKKRVISRRTDGRLWLKSEAVIKTIIQNGNNLFAGEKFKTVKIYDEYYENYFISNYGRVWSINVNRFISYKIDNYGYVRYRLHKSGKEKYISGHRLVAFAFVQNEKPELYNVVNHKDENPVNNWWGNLIWTDDVGNLNWGSAQKRRAAQRAKKILQYDLEGNLVDTFESLPDIKNRLGYNGSVICIHVKNGIPFDGYYWRHAS